MGDAIISSIEKNKILLRVAFHRYDEEEKRIEFIDTKANYLMVLTGVVLTIYCDFILEIINSSMNSKSILFLFLPVFLYGISMFFFMKSISLIQFNSTPDTKYLVNYLDDETNVNDIIDNIVYNLDYAINVNKENIEKKIRNWRWGYLFLSIGMLIMIYCIICSCI